MKHLSQGFTLIEVMVSLAIIGIALVALSNLRTTMMRSVIRDTQALDRAYAQEYFFYKTYMAQADKTASQPIPDSPYTLQYRLKEPVHGSVFEELEGLRSSMVQVEKNGTPVGQGLFTLIYTPPEKEEKAEQRETKNTQEHAQGIQPH